MSRFCQIKQIAAEFAIEIGMHDRQRIKICPGRKFHSIAQIFVQANIFRADEVTFGKEVFPIISRGKKSGALSVISDDGIIRIDFMLMCNQIVVESAR